MPLHYRRGILVKLRAYLKKHEKEALQALTDDLGKSSFEGYATELGIVYDEIRFCLSKMYGWAKPKRVPTPLAHFPSSSKIYASPYGVAAVLSPWGGPPEGTGADLRRPFWSHCSYALRSHSRGEPFARR